MSQFRRRGPAWDRIYQCICTFLPYPWTLGGQFAAKTERIEIQLSGICFIGEFRPECLVNYVIFVRMVQEIPGSQISVFSIPEFSGFVNSKTVLLGLMEVGEKVKMGKRFIF